MGETKTSIPGIFFPCGWWGGHFLPHPVARVISVITGEHFCSSSFTVKASWLNSLSSGLHQSKQLPNAASTKQNTCRLSRTSANLKKTDFPQGFLSDADGVFVQPSWEPTWKHVSLCIWSCITVVGATSKSRVGIPWLLTADREWQRQSGNVLSNDKEEPSLAHAIMQEDRWTPLELYNLQI